MTRSSDCNPTLQLLDLAYPVDDLLFRIRGLDAKSEAVSNAVLKFPHKSRIRRSSLPRPGKVYLAVYRLQCTVYFKRLTRDGFALLKRWDRGNPWRKPSKSHCSARAAALNRIGAQLQEWFQDWSSLGWFAQP